MCFRPAGKCLGTRLHWPNTSWHIATKGSTCATFAVKLSKDKTTCKCRKINYLYSIHNKIDDCKIQHTWTYIHMCIVGTIKPSCYSKCARKILTFPSILFFMFYIIYISFFSYHHTHTHSIIISSVSVDIFKLYRIYIDIFLFIYLFIIYFFKPPRTVVA